MKCGHPSQFPVTTLSKEVVLLAVLPLGILCVAQEGIAKIRTMTVVHTNNVTGHLFACPS